MSNLNVELVTPEALIFSSDAKMIVVPGIEGDFGVMVLHSPLISSLRPGVVDVYETETKISKSVFIREGFVEVNPERCTILARSAVDVTGNQGERARLLKEAEGV